MSDVDEKEIWKDVAGYEGLYKVSNLGNVYSCHINRNLSVITRKDNYRFVILRHEGKQKYKMVHRLVAEAFVPNPDNLPIVNHKDENPSNNRAYNLEWCTWQYNAIYNNAHIKRGKQLSKTVYAYNKNGDLFGTYSSTKDIADKLNMQNSNVCLACNSNHRTCGGYVLSYNKLTKQEVFNRFKLNAERKFDINSIGNLAKDKLSKPCARYTMNGEYIDTYPSTREAGRQLGISQSLIASVCRGEHEHTHGYKFKYI